MLESKNKAKVNLFIHKFTSKSMNLIESIGIDIDMDGDSSGYDGPEYTMYQAIQDVETSFSSPNWSISPDKVNIISTSLIPNKININGDFIVKKTADSSETISLPKLKIIPPKSLFLGILIAILGHSFWNGSGVIISNLGYSLGFSENMVIGISLLWILFMFCLLYTSPSPRDPH